MTMQSFFKEELEQVNGNLIDPKIINLSLYKLSKNEEKVLKYGLKFCPTPQNIDPLKESVDLEDFCRKVKLVEYFHNKSTEDDSLVKTKSNFEPPSERNTLLDNSIKYLKNLPPSTKKGKTNYNITLEERKALLNLSKNMQITIKEADKGSAVVLMDSVYYKEKVENILSNRIAYEKLPGNVDNKIMNKISKLVHKYENCLTQKEIKYLSLFEYKSSLFYCLPKIHKSQTIINEVRKQKAELINLHKPEDLSFRPIVAGPNCPTHRISHLIDRLLQPFLNLLPSYIKDSTDVLNKLPKTVTESTLLITIDVEGLYNNITHDLGLTALTYWLSKYPSLLDRIPTSFILESAKLILENNTFVFNADNYRQLMGTAMGTKFAPAYAALSLGFLENKLYQQIDSRYSSILSRQFKNNYKRYLDDILIVLDKNVIKVDEILNLLNNLDNQLIFKYETSGILVHFLDIKIYIKNNQIETDVYYKSTDTKQYLQFNSCHPRHTKNAVPYNLARRICTLVSEKDVKHNRLSELVVYLKQCGYPKNIIDMGINKASNIPRKTLLDNASNTKNDTRLLPYINTHNPNYNNKYPIIKEVVDNLSTDNHLKDVFKNVKLIHSHRQNKNLKQLLTRAEFKQTNCYKVSKCQSVKCKICDILIEGSTFGFKKDVFTVNENMSCNTFNCIYAIKCGGCGGCYIGETSNFRLRTNLHKDHIRRGVGLNVSTHIKICTQYMDETNKFHIMPIYKVRYDDLNLRKKMEAKFINKYKPSLNSC